MSYLDIIRLCGLHIATNYRKTVDYLAYNNKRRGSETNAKMIERQLDEYELRRTLEENLITVVTELPEEEK